MAIRSNPAVNDMTANALGPKTVTPLAGALKNRRESVFRWGWRVAIGVLVCLLLLLAWLVSQGEIYEAGSDLGYNLGLVGGLLMLSLLLYPLRKRFVPHDRFGSMGLWFKYHMLAGIGGPLLVIFHSTFRTGSLNGAMALYSMLLVAASGIVGRFIYRHIHRGLYGRHLTLEDAAADMQACKDNLLSVFALCPDVEARLKAFSEQAFGRAGSPWAAFWKFVALRWQSKRLAREIRQQAKSALRRVGRRERRRRAELRLSYQLAREVVDRYLDSVVKASQLAVWERLFSYWHIVHIPFLYLLVFSGIVHVIAVHMY